MDATERLNQLQMENDALRDELQRRVISYDEQVVEAPIDRAFAVASAVLADAVAGLADLERRLEPVLRPEPPGCVLGSQEQKPVQATRIASRFEELGDRGVVLLERLQDILSRLDL